MDRTPYRAAVRLLGFAAAYWSEIDADYYQINILDLPIYRQFNLIHTWLIRRMENEEARERFEMMLTEPLDWEKRQPRAKIIQSSGDDEIALMRAAAGEF